MTLYLGLQLALSSKAKSVWNGVGRVLIELTSWKRQYLCKGLRLTSITSTFSSILTCMISIFPIPCLVERTFEILQGGFLWGMASKKERI